MFECVTVRRRLLAAVLVVGVWSHTDAAPIARTSAIVRVYDTFGVSAGDFAQAQDTATAIFARAGIELQWRLCQSAGHQAGLGNDPCDDPLGEVEVSARLVRGQRGADDSGILGVSLIDTARGHGSLASVFPDRVRELAFRARVPYAPLLGRALAHEIGHLLLGTTAHSAWGVMRPQWNLAVLRAHAPEDWTFSADDVGRIARSLQARSARPEPQALAALLVP